MVRWINRRGEWEKLILTYIIAQHVRKYRVHSDAYNLTGFQMRVRYIGFKRIKLKKQVDLFQHNFA